VKETRFAEGMGKYLVVVRQGRRCPCGIRGGRSSRTNLSRLAEKRRKFHANNSADFRAKMRKTRFFGKYGKIGLWRLFDE